MDSKVNILFSLHIVCTKILCFLKTTLHDMFLIINQLLFMNAEYLLLIMMKILKYTHEVFNTVNRDHEVLRDMLENTWMDHDRCLDIAQESQRNHAEIYEPYRKQLC